MLVTALVASLGGCAGVYWEDAKPRLPQLTATEEAFDASARADSELQLALESPELRQSCPQCDSVLPTLTAHAEERIEAVGGVWQPWPTPAPSDAPTRPTVSAPTLAATELAQNLAQSGVKTIASAADADGDHRLLLISAGAGRIGDALALANAAGVEVQTTEQWLQPLGDVSGLFTIHASPGGEFRNATTKVVAQWDCASEILGTFGADPSTAVVAGSVESVAVSQMNALNEAITLALPVVNEDDRSPSCLAAFMKDEVGGADDAKTDLQRLQAQLAAANLHFAADAATSSSDEILATSSPLVTGLRYWQRLAPANQIPALPGLQQDSAAGQS